MTVLLPVALLLCAPLRQERAAAAAKVLESQQLRPQKLKGPLPSDCEAQRRIEVTLSRGTKITALHVECPNRARPGDDPEEILDLEEAGLRFWISREWARPTLDSLKTIHLSGGTQLLVVATNDGNGRNSGATDRLCVLDDVAERPACLPIRGVVTSAIRALPSGRVLTDHQWEVELSREGELCLAHGAEDPHHPVSLLEDDKVVFGGVVVPLRLVGARLVAGKARYSECGDGTSCP